jgi:hypothetical protein
MQFLRLGCLVAVTVAALAFASGAWAAEASDPATHITHDQFDPGTYEDSTEIDNRWFPLVPGTQYVLEGEADRGAGLRPHRVVFTVTGVTKIVNGVKTLVVWDRDFYDGPLVEEEIAFFAQDRAGNVWHLGQYPEEYEGGKLVKSPGWIAGEAGARAGIAMKAEPKLGAPSYSQGFAPPPINWDDRARAYRIGIRTCVPVACYDDVLVTEEFEPSIPGAFQLKYYAPDVGNVRVGWRGKNDKDHEVLVLIDYLQLDDAQMEKVRERVTALDENAFRRIEGYDSTSPVARA